MLLEERVKQLEANVDLLNDKSDHRYRELQGRLKKQGERVDELRADLDRRHAEHEAERREQHRESVTLQWWGTGLFVIGAVLGGLANTC